jgi:hypothetical protein
MNFSFLDPISEICFRAVSTPNVNPTPCELDDSWKKFEKELGYFKTQYAKARAAVTILQSRISSKQADINVIELAAKVLKSDDLKDMISKIIEEYEQTEGLGDLLKEYGEALGRSEAMKTVMMDTNSERYARFTCFVCMDSLVDSLLDPCNHVICERCWVRSRTQTCPGCRTEVREVRKIFTLS